MTVAFEGVPKEFVSKVAVYDHKSPVTSAVSSINRDGVVLVTKDGEYLGIVDDRALLRSNLKMPKKQSIGKFVKKVPVIDSGTSIEKAILYFYNSGAKALPYSEGRRPGGVLKRQTMLKAMLSLHLVSKYQAKDMMSTPVVAIAASANVSQARSAMQQNKINRLVVLQDNKVFGIITARDLTATSSVLEKRSPERAASSKVNLARVADVCERDIKSVEHRVTAEEAIRLMVENGISSLLVRRNNRPVGLLTVRDILEAFLAGESMFSNNVFVSGLDDYTKEYEQDILESLDRLAEKINRFGKFKVGYITLDVKRRRSRNYELKSKVGMTNRAPISVSSTGFSLDAAFKELENKIYRLIKQEKEVVVTHRKEMERDVRYEYEE